MLVPSLFGNNVVDDWMDFPWKNFGFPGFLDKSAAEGFKTVANVMKTDIKELENEYELMIEVPGFQKEDIKASIENGYLTIEATRSTETENNNEEYIRRERCVGKTSRSFYVGDNIAKEDIIANYENGTLRLLIPKKKQQEIEAQKYIEIQG